MLLLLLLLLRNDSTMHPSSSADHSLLAAAAAASEGKSEYVLFCKLSDGMVWQANKCDGPVMASERVTLNLAEGTGKHSFLSYPSPLFVLISLQPGTENF